MRPGLRSLTALLAAVALATCSDAPVDAGPRPASAVGQVGFEPVFNERATFAAANASAFGISYEDVRLRIRAYPDTTVVVRDTTIRFTPDSHELTLELSVPIQSDGQRFNATLDYISRTLGVVFHGSVVLKSYRLGQGVPEQPEMSIDYVGPGFDVESLVVSPDSAFVIGDAATSLAVIALDEHGDTIAPPPLNWSSSDASIASVAGNGATVTVQGRNTRGRATITALSPTGVKGIASVVTGLPAASIALISGGGQTGSVHSQLAEPAVVEVRASDDIGVPGVTVLFAAPAGGSVGTASVVTDATGRASTTMTLGGAVGAQAFAATAGTFAVAIPATATAGSVASMTIVSGAAQSDTIGARLAPLSVRLVDAFGNGVANTSITWTRVRGSGALGAPTTITNADGVATNSYTLGSVVGSDSVAVSVGDGPTTGFAMTTRAGNPAAIAAVSGGGQSAMVGAALAPFVVRVTDAGSNPVASVAVAWSAVNGTIAATSATDATGQTSNVMTLGQTIGAASATASIAGDHSVTFNVTAQESGTGQVVFTSQPAGGASNTIMPAFAVTVRDASGNPTTTPTSVTIALGTNSVGATLSGTLTRTTTDGVATFDDLRIDRPGTDFTLVASIGDSVVATSATFNIAATEGTTTLAFVAPAGVTSYNALAGSVITPALEVAVRDSSGNVVTSATNVITVALTSPNGAVLGGTKAVNAVNGVATFRDLSIDIARTGYTLTATADGFAAATSLPIDIFAPGTARLIIAGGDDLSAMIGTATSVPPRVRVTDANDEPASGASIVFTVKGGGGSVAAVNGASASSATVPTDASGYATLGNWTLGATAGSNTLEARLDPTTAVVFTATATSSDEGGGGNDGVPANVVVVSGDGQSGTVGTPLASPFVVKVTDSRGSAVAGAVVTWTATSGSLTPSTTTGADGTASNTMLLGTTAAPVTATASVSGVGAVSFSATPRAGAPASLAIVSQPTSASAGATLDPITVAVRDAFGNATTATNAVTIAIVTNPSAGTLSGTRNRTAVNGLVTFNDLSVDLEGTGYALRATSTGLTSATTQPIDIVPVGSQVLAFSETIAGGTAGVALTPAITVEIRDAQGTLVSGATNAVSLAIQSGPSGTVTGAGPVAAVNGVATFSNLILPTAGSYTLRASASGFASVVSNQFVVTAGAPARLAIIAGDDQVATAGSATSIPPRVQVTDATGNPVSGASVSFAVTAGGGTVRLAPGGSVVTSGEVVADANGYATLDAWLLGAVAGANTLEARIGTLVASFSATGSNGAAGSIAIVGGNDQSATVGTALSAPFVVRVVDGASNPVAGAVVTWSATNGSLARITITGADGTTSNIMTAGTVAGSAAAVATIANGQAVTFGVTAHAGALTQLVFTTQPTSATASTTLSPVVVALRDAYGNAVTSAAPVTIAIGANPANGSLGGTTTRPATAGSATFNDLSIDQAGAGYSLVASSGTIAATSQAFNVASAPPAAIAIVSGDAQSGIVGGALAQALVVRVTDASGDPVANATVAWSARRGTIGAIYTATNGDGSTSNTLILSTMAGSDTITATVSGHSVSFVASGSAADAARLVFLVPPGTTSYSATTTTPVTTPTTVQVAVQDAYGNLVTSSAAAISLVLDNANGATLIGAPTTTAVNGVAEFALLRVDRVGAYTVTAGSPGLIGATSLPIVVSFGR